MVRQKLKSFFDPIWDNNAPPSELRNQMMALHKHLHQWADLSVKPGFTPTDPDNPWGQDTILSSGKAISPHSAGMCILEYVRTAVFARGIRQAIEDALTKHSHRPVKILYAGTGPFAPLALSQVSHFPPEQVKFTFVDIHPISLDTVKAVFNVLQLQDYVDSYHLGDICELVEHGSLQAKGPFDGVITEVMQRALEKETQVQVTAALRKELRPDGFFIPENVRVSTVFLDPNKEHVFVPADTKGPIPKPERERIGMEPIIDLNINTVLNTDDTGEVPLKEFQLQRFDPQRHHMNYITTIQVYGEHVLGEYDCSLTLPTPANTEFTPEPGMKLKASYYLGSENEYPGIRLRLVDE